MAKKKKKKKRAVVKAKKQPKLKTECEGFSPPGGHKPGKKT